jgi:hypothetical protein
VAKYEDNTPRTKKDMIPYKFADGNGNGNAARAITIPLLFLKSIFKLHFKESCELPDFVTIG